MKSTNENIRNALIIHKAILEALINRLVQLEEILSRTDGVTDHDRAFLERLRARRACETIPVAALPDEEPLRYPRSSDVEGNGIPRRSDPRAQP
jgi:hypothetical protein